MKSIMNGGSKVRRERERGREVDVESWGGAWCVGVALLIDDSVTYVAFTKFCDMHAEKL